MGPSGLAFCQKLKSTEMYPDVNGMRESAFEFQHGPLNVLVIDDQLSGAWEHEICTLFAVDHCNRRAGSVTSVKKIGKHAQGGLSVYGTDNPSVLLQQLGCQAHGSIETRVYLKRKYDSPASLPDQEPWLLVLDLLLFPGKPDAAREWFRKLYKVALKLDQVARDIREGGGTANFAWRIFDADELAQLDCWLDPNSEGGQDEGGYEVALSLLPRLCALRWPSVPIVLLSAVTRRGIFGKLRVTAIFISRPPNLACLLEARKSRTRKMEHFILAGTRRLRSAISWWLFKNAFCNCSKAMDSTIPRITVHRRRTAT